MATRRRNPILPARPVGQPACLRSTTGVIGSTAVAKPGTLQPSSSRLRPPLTNFHTSKPFRPPSIFSGHQTSCEFDPQRVTGTQSPPGVSSGSRRSVYCAAGGGSQSSTVVVKSQQRAAVFVARSLTSAGTSSVVSQTLNQRGNNFSGGDTSANVMNPLQKAKCQSVSASVRSMQRDTASAATNQSFVYTASTSLSKLKAPTTGNAALRTRKSPTGKHVGVRKAAVVTPAADVSKGIPTTTPNRGMGGVASRTPEPTTAAKKSDTGVVYGHDRLRATGATTSLTVTTNGKNWNTRAATTSRSYVACSRLMRTYDTRSNDTTKRRLVGSTKSTDSIVRLSNVVLEGRSSRDQGSAKMANSRYSTKDNPRRHSSQHRQQKTNTYGSPDRSTAKMRIVALPGACLEDNRNLLDQPSNEEFQNKSALTGSDTSPLGDVTSSDRRRSTGSVPLADVDEDDGEYSSRRLRCCDRESCSMLDRMENELASKLSWSTDMELVDADDGDDEDNDTEQNQLRTRLGDESTSSSSPSSSAGRRRMKKTVTSSLATVDCDVEQRHDVESSTGGGGYFDTPGTSCTTMTFATSMASDLINVSDFGCYDPISSTNNSSTSTPDNDVDKRHAATYTARLPVSLSGWSATVNLSPLSSTNSEMFESASTTTANDFMMKLQWLFDEVALAMSPQLTASAHYRPPAIIVTADAMTQCRHSTDRRKTKAISSIGHRRRRHQRPDDCDDAGDELQPDVIDGSIVGDVRAVEEAAVDLSSVVLDVDPPTSESTFASAAGDDAQWFPLFSIISEADRLVNERALNDPLDVGQPLSAKQLAIDRKEHNGIQDKELVRNWLSTISSMSESSIFSSACSTPPGMRRPTIDFEHGMTLNDRSTGNGKSSPVFETADKARDHNFPLTKHNFRDNIEYCSDQPLPVSLENEGGIAMSRMAGISDDVSDDRMSNHDCTSEDLVRTLGVREEASGGPSQNNINSAENDQIAPESIINNAIPRTRNIQRQPRNVLHPNASIRKGTLHFDRTQSPGFKPRAPLRSPTCKMSTDVATASPASASAATELNGVKVKSDHRRGGYGLGSGSSHQSSGNAVTGSKSRPPHHQPSSSTASDNGGTAARCVVGLTSKRPSSGLAGLKRPSSERSNNSAALITTTHPGRLKSSGGLISSVHRQHQQHAAAAAATTGSLSAH